MKHKIKHIHFVGVGGVGMSGIAEVLHCLGYVVSGSDLANNANTDRLKSVGIKIYIGHNATNIANAEVIVVSSAISQSNVEVIAAKESGVIIVPRAMMLAELMRFKYGIAIAGTHGKTTTTSLCAEVLSKCSFDPTFLIGGKLAVTNSNAQLGSGDYLIAEADESDASFLYLNPLISVVTNIDLDHMSTYEYSEARLKQAFIDFLHKLPFYGVAVLCNEDQRVREIIPLIKRKVITYGLSPESSIYAYDIKPHGIQMKFKVCIKETNNKFDVILNLSGMHNVLNSLAAIAVGLECDGKIEDIVNALTNFHGVARRMEHYPLWNFANKTIEIIDDYGHHPAEISATISALKEAYPHKRLIVVFQPHRYTRTRDLFDNFITVLSTVNEIIITEIYAAGEEPIAAYDGRSLVKALKINGLKNVIFAENLDQAKKLVTNMVNDGDIVLTLGAGSIGKLPKMLLEK